MERNIYGVFMAAGSGTRMGGGIPKQFLTISGRPILQMSIECLLSAVPGINVVTVLPKTFIQSWKDYCNSCSFDCPQIIVEGGLTRFHSVKNALSKVPDGAIVMIHDGVRPLVSTELIVRMLAKMKNCRAVVPAIPVTDTLRSTDQHIPAPDRSKLVAVQTPQIFLSEDIKSAYLQAYDTAFTDDASVAARKGIPITLVEGEKTNLKITTPEDLLLARAIISLRMNQQ